MENKSLKETERSCVLCCQDVDIFAVGKCDHPVCYQCSTKMRVLCDQKYCAVCREELDKVIFIKKLQPFATIDSEQFQCEKKYDIYFTNGKIYAQFRKILQSECPQCPEPKVFSKFEELEQHMRKQHELFCCKLCAKHLKIFTHERKWYSRKDLARHRTQGDPDDTSHRGHPLCKFCDDRYLDNDELLKHLRRDHYFCHFCDSDGAQEYYSDYPYLRDHFRESHYLCEEGRCSTEQFTHAFRTEIDYKAHKAAAHSKSRAEARQNRHIELQFNYTPRHQRRTDGIGGEDYEEVDRFNRQARAGRGASRMTHQNRRVSWRYNREEEDREVAAAVRASIAASRQEERRQALEREIPKARREEKMEMDDDRNLGSAAKPTEVLTPRDTGRSFGVTESIKGEDFPVLGATSADTPLPPLASMIKSAPVKLEEADFPSLSSATLSTPMTPAYSVQSWNPSSFQEEDFPALVSKIRPQKPVGNTLSAWSQCGNKNTAQATKAGPRPVPPSNTSASHLLASVSQYKKKSTQGNGAKAPSRIRTASSEEEEESGKTVQDIRSVPTMLDISSLLTSKGLPSGPKVSKRKKQPTAAMSSTWPTAGEVSVAQKENVPEASLPPVQNSPKPTATPKSNLLFNGNTNKPLENPAVVSKEPPGLQKQADCNPCLLPGEEEFPALIPRKPPPGFKNTFPVKATQNGLPPPPPGLVGPPSKPPPGFTGVPLNANIGPALFTATETAAPPPRTYLKPEKFQERNMDLIQSIKNFLQNDESKFNEFKTYSVQFRQGVISAAQYHKSCQELLGDNFRRIFNELLVLLPDTAKQQELLAAHGDLKALEKQAGSKPKKNKKNAWQSSSTNSSLELDCLICPACSQVLAQKDFAAHKTLHMADDDFPSLQAISKIIS
ncbi:E3 ubiquitin-protein ligase ZNF598 [Scleropages formosus]|uniref:RING-type E3 ubiquitin transferase n=2 Tax=Scleropages formosus TaxID=113540 RepID=A0A8C9R7L6_SCLFO|nr:E3 ubiquitin-protein ligase ZNF598 [Scleropages formosus]